MSAGITVDTSQVTRGMRQLAAGLERIPARVGLEQASAVAARIRPAVPVRTGRLRSTVSAVRVPDGGAVTYGGGLPYAGYIEHRTHAVADALEGAPESFASAMSSAAEQEVSRL